MLRTGLLSIFTALLLLSHTAQSFAQQVDIVKDGKAVVSGIYIKAGLNPEATSDEKKSPLPYAAADLSEIIQRMTGASIEVKEVEKAADVPAGGAIVLGSLANELGASPKQTSLWKDSTRVVVKGGRVLIGGESDTAANAGVYDLLHEKGVRFFLPSNIPGDPGTIIPQTKSLSFEARDVEKHPFVRSRRIWGHNMGASEGIRYLGSKWVRRTQGVSAVEVPAVHAWSHLIPTDKQKPEYFAIKRYGPDGEPVRGGQFCVSNPEVAPLVAETLIARFRANPDLLVQSISPNDGGGACICLDCQALDPIGYLEPSSGKPALSDRYLHFFNHIAEAVAKEYPDRYLAYLVYSDYSRAPVKVTDIHPMILPIFAPIRYPRMQSMFNLNSEQNIRLRNEVKAYAKYARNIGYYGYNYNLAETIVPFSKISIWSSDLPWMVEQGLNSMTVETLGNWNSNGPHIYLSARYTYSGDDPKAIMADYFEKLGGAAAKPIEAYWMRVDRAFAESDIHSGSFFGIEQILTPAVLAELQGHLSDAAAAAKTEREKSVVAFFQSGLDQGKYVVGIINDLNDVKFVEAAAKRDKLKALSESLQADHVVSHYPVTYMRWFMDHVIDSAVAIPESGGEIAKVLPREWHIRMDHYNVGVEEEWFDPSHGSAKWLTAKTWGAPSLYSQGFGDFKGYQWLKVETDVPAKDAEKLMMWFGSNDGKTRLWINGQPVPFAMEQGAGESKKVVEVNEWPRGWRAFSVPVGKFIKPGEKNTVVIRIDHSLNDLNLGGILRPVILYVPGDKELKEVEDTYQQMTM